MVKNLSDVAKNALEKQYTYTSVGDLAVQITSVYEQVFGQITKTFGNEILNFNTCTSEALDNFWGQIFKINRNFVDENGNLLTLTDEQFREIIKIRAFGTTWDGGIQSMNTFLQELFKDRGNVYMLDPQNMTYEIFVFNFQLENWERYLFANYDIFPRSAGVASYFEEILENVYFGFGYYGQLYPNPLTTGFGTYTGDEQGQFLKYDVTPVIGETYKLTIYTQPTNAVVKINGKIQNNISFYPNTIYTYEVSADGYESIQSGGAITQDTVLNINLTKYKTLTINTIPSDAVVTINGVEQSSFSAPSGTSYTWSVSKAGYNTQTGSGVLTEDTTLNIELELSVATLTINPTPSDAVVTINGTVRNSITLNIGENYSYSVVKDGYYTKSGSGVLTEDTTLNIALQGYTIDVITPANGVLRTFTDVTSYFIGKENIIINGDLYTTISGSPVLLNEGGWSFVSYTNTSNKVLAIKNGDVYLVDNSLPSFTRITTDGGWKKTGSYYAPTYSTSATNNVVLYFLKENGNLYYKTYTMNSGNYAEGDLTLADTGCSDVFGYNRTNIKSSATQHYLYYGSVKNGNLQLGSDVSPLYDVTDFGNVTPLSPLESSSPWGRTTDYTLQQASQSTSSPFKINSFSNYLDGNYKKVGGLGKGSSSAIALIVNKNNALYSYDGSSLQSLADNCLDVYGVIYTSSSLHNVYSAVAIINNGDLYKYAYNGTNIISSKVNDYKYLFMKSCELYLNNASTTSTSPVLAIRQNP